MEIMTRGDKFKITPAIKSYVQEKLTKLDKYFENSNELKVTVNARVKDEDQIIEVTIPIKKFTLRAEEKHRDLYAAIDLVVDKLERQIRKNKTRIRAKYKKQDFQEFNFNYENEEINSSKIAKRKVIEAKPMDEEEAVLQLELIDHDFFIFKNVNKNCFSVLYKRKDGNYGIIDTK